MYFLSGASLKHFVVGGLIVAIMSLIAISSMDYINNRVTAFVNPDSECIEDYCWQTRQANIAIGSGGFWERA